MSEARITNDPREDAAFDWALANWPKEWILRRSQVRGVLAAADAVDDHRVELRPLAVRLVSLLRESDALIQVFVPPTVERERWREDLRQQIALTLAEWDAPQRTTSGGNGFAHVQDNER